MVLGQSRVSWKSSGVRAGLLTTWKTRLGCYSPILGVSLFDDFQLNTGTLQVGEMQLRSVKQLLKG